MKYAIIATLVSVSALATYGGRTVENFHSGWSFSRDGKNWSSVCLPHDAAIAGPFEPAGSAHTGKLPWKGVFRYRTTLVMSEAPKGKRVFLDFDGVQGRSVCSVNGQPCGIGHYGYLGYRADVTPYLFGGTNEIEVTSDTTLLASRWYPGAGIYRRVRKIVTDDLYLDDRDMFVETPKVDAQSATVRVTGAVTSRRATADAAGRVTVTLRDPDGRTVATRSTDVSVAACAKGAFDVSFDVANPRLWEMVPNAALYTTEVAFEGAGATDALCVKTGLRSFRFDANEGFFLNGRRVQLNGVDLHSDLGILGMAFNRSAMRRQLAVMRDMGANALRTSHNPPAPELLELCDEMGIFVWDECFDKWNATCGRGDLPLEEFVAARLKEFVRRDRNHASVFIWSIGNEISPGKATPPGQEHWAGAVSLGTSAERCARFRAVVRALDASRPVGIGSCFPDAAFRGDYVPLDVSGWNYKAQYRGVHKAHPGQPLLYSESASAFSDYGCYPPALPKDKTDYVLAARSVDSYDRCAAPWSDIPDREFELMETDRYVAGEFVWTGIDYLGEPSPYGLKDVHGKAKNCPLKPEELARSSYFGICDLLVFPKDRFYLYRAHWNKSAFTLHIVPDHWTFPERKGQKMPVYVYTSANEAELFVNGVSQGRRRKEPSATMQKGYYAGCARYRLMWDDVVWQPGEVKAVAYGADGKPLGEETLRTAGKPVSVVLTSESATLPADGDELVFVKVTLADEKGTPVPNDHRRISFAVEGPAEIVSVGNSDPHGYDSFKDVASHPLRFGRAGLALRRTAPGKVTLKASADGLATGIVAY